MWDAKRDLNNPPAYYYTLTTKQQRAWRRNARKIQSNERLRATYAPFRPSTDINIIHIHYYTDLNTLNDLIGKASRTHLYVVDTENGKNQQDNKGALIQIQMIHSTTYSTVMLIETNYLPDRQTMLYEKIEELWSKIFNHKNEIIAWGSIYKEFEDFQHIEFIRIGNEIDDINIQSLFRSCYNQKQQKITHPEMERRDDDDPADEEMGDDYDDTEVWSLQKAIATTFHKFLDKSLTINWWQYGLDEKLNTWRRKLFSQHQYNEQTEKQERLKMIEYATNDCTSVAEIYFHIHPNEIINKQSQSTPPKTTIQITTTQIVPQIRTTSTNWLLQLEDKLSDISEDELVELLKPKFDKKPVIIYPPQKSPPDEVIITATEEEINELNINQPPVYTLAPSTLTKPERQRRKNLKLKWKQKHRPDFQRKIKRPIYYRYDYRKIRSQLANDNIHTSHQITINKEKGEVIIGFKTQEEEKARNIMKINYFSREQYKARWGLNE